MKKLYKLLFLPALFAGIIFLNCAFNCGLPRGVSVNGVDVGGLSLPVAVERLRADEIKQLKGKALHICADERVYTYYYPEFNFIDNFEDFLAGIDKKGAYYAPINVYLNGMDEVIEGICASVERTKVEPYVRFNLSGAPFDYFEGCDGISCDRVKLANDIVNSLNGSFERVNVACTVAKRGGDMLELRQQTHLLYTFTTLFDGENSGRVSNIKLASQRINGCVLQSGQTFSFNEVVGARSRQNGFVNAKIIENGAFVDGVGGGVCQVSTTLYNAALLSGLEICESHPHSLQVAYVPPSRDAMVSGTYCDLKFKNNQLTPIYIRMNVNYDSVTCSIYGGGDGYNYSFVSQVVQSISPPTTLCEGEQGRVFYEGKEGIISNGYLVKQKGDFSQKVLVRRDSYAPVARRVGGKTNNETILP